VSVSPPSQATILVVDDVPANIGALGETLEGAGYRVLAARRAKRAQVRVKAPPDLVLLDVHMPVWMDWRRADV